MALKWDHLDWNNKGLSYNNLGRYVDAITCFDKAIQLDPMNAGAWHNKSFALISLSRIPEACDSCNEALRINPSHAAALLNKAQLLAMSGELKEAFDYIYKSLSTRSLNDEIVANAAAMLSLYKFESKDEHAICRKISSLEIIPRSVDGFVNVGLCHLKVGDLEKALCLFRTAENLDPDDSMVWFELMELYFKRQDADNALIYCNKLIDNNSHFEQAVRNKSIVLSNTGRMDQAIRLLTDTLETNEKFDVLWITLSGLFERINHFDKALWAAEKCLIELNESNNKDNEISYVFDVIQKLQSKRGKSDSSFNPEIAKALLELDRCEREFFKEKQHTDAIKRLIQMYLNDGNKQEAIRYCDKLIKTTNYITDFGNKAIVMSYFGENDGAIALLHDILRERPNLDSLWYILSDIYEKAGDKSAAFNCANNCKIALQKSNNPNLQKLAEVEAKLATLRTF